MREVAVIGVSMIKFGRYPDRDVSQLAAQAGLLALKDAGVDMKAIESLYSGNLYPPPAPASASCSRWARPASPSSTSPTPAPPAPPPSAKPSSPSPAAPTTSSSPSAASRWASRASSASGGDPATSLEGRVGSDMMPAVFGMAGMEHAASTAPSRSTSRVSRQEPPPLTQNPSPSTRTRSPLEKSWTPR